MESRCSLATISATPTCPSLPAATEYTNTQASLLRVTTTARPLLPHMTRGNKLGLIYRRAISSHKQKAYGVQQPLTKLSGLLITQHCETLASTLLSVNCVIQNVNNLFDSNTNFWPMGRQARYAECRAVCCGPRNNFSNTCMHFKGKRAETLPELIMC